MAASTWLTKFQSFKISSESLIIAIDDVSDLWPLVKDSFEARIPLKKTLLNNKARNPVVVEKLPVEFVLTTDPRLRSRFPLEQSPFFFRLPYATILLVTCEDIDDYKAILKPRIKGMVQNDEREWFIVFVSKANPNDPTGKQAKRIYSKLEVDFSSKRRERCCKLDLSASDAASWEEIDARTSECIRNTLERRVQSYDEVKRLNENRSMPGWSFSNLFTVMEGLAFMFELAYLFEDALREYDDIEQIYLEIVNIPSSKMRDFGGMDHGDDRAALLEVSRKQVTQFTVDDYFREFDFRQYLFARQASLLFKLNRTIDVAGRGLYFIYSFSKILSMHEKNLPFCMREIWVVSACLSLIKATVECFTPRSVTPDAEKEFYRLQADLNSLARTKLMRLSEILGYGPLHSTSPRRSLYSSGSPASPSAAAAEKPKKLDDAHTDAVAEILKIVTHEGLKKALSSPEGYEAMYLELTRAAADNYHRSRKRHGVVLDGEVAALHLRTGNFDSAAKLYEKVCALYSGERWHALVAEVLPRLAECQKQLGDLGGYLSSCIKLLSLDRGLVPVEQRKALQSEVVKLAHSGLKVPLPVDVSALMTFCGQPGPPLELFEGDPGTLPVTVWSGFTDEISLQSLSMTLSATFSLDESAKTIKSADVPVLSPGKNTISMVVQPQKPGSYVLGALTGQLGQVAIRSHSCCTISAIGSLENDDYLSSERPVRPVLQVSVPRPLVEMKPETSRTEPELSGLTEPFRLSTRVVANENAGVFLLQVTLLSQVNVGVTILDAALSLQGGFHHATSSSDPLWMLPIAISGYAECALVFLIKLDDHENGDLPNGGGYEEEPRERSALSVSYKISGSQASSTSGEGKIDEQDVLTFKGFFQLQVPVSDHQVAVGMLPLPGPCPRVGKQVILQWRIERLKKAQSSEIEQLAYEVKASPASWMVAGRRKGFVSLAIQSGTKLVVSIACLPLVAGHVRPPSLELCGIDHSQVSHCQPASHLVYILPPSPCYAFCLEEKPQS
ncbi:trafficking protein particle complex II-specific subunit 130 homolog isoform X1 [Selaginella moellendorffii]|nr:trafficking protein particle complex II-specific subunit 130 homolog isoform X1 [Selaginella moellendorffii]|eukprot:XP_024539146.1 trafficking protein particle complex II-specific subunit 130 homolog isoform X1 [Selaginella moellendorffii]